MSEQSTARPGLRTRGIQDARRVNLIGVGAPRTATTSLARMLAATGQVFVPDGKEVNGFGITPELTQTLYDLRFAEARGQHRYIADFSPVYLSGACVPQRIKSYNPDARIIATLREPIARMLSQYCHMRQTQDPSLDSDLRLDVNAYIRRGLSDLQAGDPAPDRWYSAALNVTHSFYGRSLERYFACFARKQILVLIYDDLLQPRGFWRRGRWERGLRSFLGVAVNRRVWENQAADEQLTVEPDLVAELRALFAPQVKTAGRLIGRDLSALWGY
ncbi:sulfotransferase [Mesorhizobium sp. MSK_1335]|uniref:Sulfotransferase n=1 Tax=Mesorhizobium montanum TaxID=3072323 RepID=A0ABU4ZQP7_9HYPH|nr:sulfotransferase [Mesorhizobium sp. MSK_1335]MDX8527729.1 sulfotransferase [Mesorhizobium sp. MSK_1335]